MFTNLVLYLRNFIFLFKTASITFLSYILFELLDVEHGSPISHKNVKCNFSRPCAGYRPPSPMGNLIHYYFLIQHYISHKKKYVGPLRMAALACNITLRTLPAKQH